MSEILALASKEVSIIGLCVAFVAYIIYCILTDKLVTAKRLEAVEKRVEAERIEKEKWQQAHTTLQKAHDQTLGQNSVLLENSRLFIPFIQAFGTGATRFLQAPLPADEEETG